MTPSRSFRLCPSCGSDTLSFNGINRYQCTHCDFVFYQNTAAAAGAILTLGSRILLLRRGTEPAKGSFDFPGGFIDPGESAEAALEREIREEIDLSVFDLTYFRSGPNFYEYRGVTYPTCDLVFTGRIEQEPENLQRSEIDGYELREPEEIDIDTIAFPSLRSAMAAYIATKRGESRRE